MTPAISIVIPTRDRRDSLLRLLAAIDRTVGDPSGVEAIVVTDGCTDDTARVARGASPTFSLKIIEIGTASGAARARNLGAEAAQGDVLVFVDDDIEPTAPTWLDEHRQFHGPDPARSETLLLGAPAALRRAGMRWHEIAIWGWWESRFERMERPGHRFTHEEVSAGVLSVPRALFRAIGGFDESFARSGEDLELGARLIARGVRVGFSRGAGGIHHEIRNRRRMIERKDAEAEADLELAARHPGLFATQRLRRAVDGSASDRWLHRVAPVGPLGGVGLAIAGAGLDLLEWLRWRRPWRALQAATMYYAYWRGVVRALGGRRNTWRRLAELERKSRRVAADERLLELDLDAGLDAAVAALERARPRGVRIALGSIPVAMIPSVAGAEALRGPHLRAVLAERPVLDTLAGALAVHRLGSVNGPA